jgi:hypothetical protein
MYNLLAVCVDTLTVSYFYLRTVIVGVCVTHFLKSCWLVASLMIYFTVML